MKPKKHKTGRPKWIPADLVQVESLAARGLTKEQIAHCLGISYQTLNERTKDYTEFADAIKRGASKGISIIANALYESGKNGNTTAQIFFLKARAKWIEGDLEQKDNNEHERKIRNAESECKY